MKKARLITAVLAVVMLLSLCLAGCGNNSTPSATAAPNTTENNDAPTTATYKFSMGHHHAVDSITDHMCNDFAKLVNEKSNGAIEITVYPGAQLGNEQEAADGLLVGTMDFAMVTAAGCYVDAVDGFGVDTLPFMFESWDEISYVLTQTEYGKVLNDKLIAAGARILGYAPCGARQMIFADEEVTSYKQMNGMTMRSPESTLYTSMFSALGASPTPVTWSECYGAMQNKIADGMDSPISSIRTMNFCEVCKYALMTNHMWSTATIVCNEALYQSLPDDLKAVLDEAGAEAAANATQEGIEAEQVDMDYCINEAGMTFIELPEGEAAELAEVMMTMKEEWLAGHPGRQEMFDLCMSCIQQYRDMNK